VALALKPGERIGLIAGGGQLPLEVAHTLREAGHEPFVLVVDGEPNLAPELIKFEHAVQPLENFAGFVRVLRAHKVTHVVMAGAVTRRPKWSSISWNWDLVRMLAVAVPALAKGDDALLKAAIGQFERNGMKIVGPHEIVPHLVAQLGPMTNRRPDAVAQRDIDAGAAAARAIGLLDIGQGAVSVGGRVIALEGIEGTDGLLARVKELRDHGRLAGRTGGVLIKCSKPGQELRADLPGIGPKTVGDAHAAKLVGIAVEAERTLIVDYSETMRRANELDMFIVGINTSSTA
jgi:DUF1009 family protein